MNKTIYANDIQDILVGTIANESSYAGLNVSIGYLTHELAEEWKEMLILVQQMEYHSPEQKKAKSKIPRFYICGTFDFSIKDRFPIFGKPIIKSGLMTIDIDGKDNDGIDIWSLRKEIFNLPYVYACIKSVSGHGYYVIIAIEDTDYTKEYYHYISKLWKQKYGINCDPKADTLIRARILSYDEEIDNWIKKDTYIKVWDLKEYVNKDVDMLFDSTNKIDLFSYRMPKNTDVAFLDKATNKAMELIINDGYYAKSYNAWYHLGAELKNFANGWELFLKSSQNKEYNDDVKTIEKRWKKIEASGIDDDLRKKWMGMAKNRFGKDWIKNI